MHHAVSAAKERLPSSDQTGFRFDLRSTSIEATIERRDIESWVADDLDRLGQAVDIVLERAAMSAREIDRVFPAGDTSFVPAGRNLFAARFGESRIETGDEPMSIAHGLAMISNRDDIDLWCDTADERDPAG